jgi:alkyl hydroperoxide reductase subunit F
MLDAQTTAQLSSYLERVKLPVELVASLDGSPKSRELWSLLEETAALSPLITAVHDDEAATDGRRPSFDVRRAGTDVAVRFAGIPLGHEFTSYVLALLQVGGHPSTAADDVLQQVRDLDADLHFETFFSLTCQNCPDVVQALNLMSILNPRISHTAIDGALFQDEVAEREVLAVPTVFVNGEPFGQGRMDARGDRGQARHGRAGSPRGGDGGEGPLRRARGRRRPGRRGGRDLRGPQGHPHRDRGGALRRPGARHHGDRELRLGRPHRGPEAGRGSREQHVGEYDVDVMKLQSGREARARDLDDDGYVRRSASRTAPSCARAPSCSPPARAGAT